MFLHLCNRRQVCEYLGHLRKQFLHMSSKRYSLFEKENSKESEQKKTNKQTKKKSILVSMSPFINDNVICSTRNVILLEIDRH